MQSYSIKSLSYSSGLILVGTILGFIPLVINLVLGWEEPAVDIRGTRFLIVVIIGLISAIDSHNHIHEKRERLFAQLPIRPQTLALSRNRASVVLWCVLMLLYWMATSVIRPYPVKWIVWETLTLNGLVFSALALQWIQIDLSQMIRSAWIRSTVWFLFFLILWTGLIVFFSFSGSGTVWSRFFSHEHDMFILDWSSRPAVALISNLLGILVWSLMIRIHDMKKTYTR